MSLLWDLGLALQITTKAQGSLISQGLYKSRNFDSRSCIENRLGLFLSLGFVLYRILLVY